MHFALKWIRASLINMKGPSYDESWLTNWLMIAFSFETGLLIFQLHNGEGLDRVDHQSWDNCDFLTSGDNSQKKDHRLTTREKSRASDMIYLPCLEELQQTLPNKVISNNIFCWKGEVTKTARCSQTKYAHSSSPYLDCYASMNIKPMFVLFSLDDRLH